MKKGFFITFEGGEGCGKSTQAELLYKFLKQKKYPVLLTYEPGATPVGEKIRALLLSNRHKKISRETEALLYLACRAQHVSEIIAPALASGKIVLCDRFTDSTLAYQGFARGISMKPLKIIEQFSRNGLVPDLTILLDADPKKMFPRIKSKRDRLESESVQFHEKVRWGYLALAKKDARRILKLDAGEGMQVLHEKIKKRIIKLLESVNQNEERKPCPLNRPTM